ncbi:leucyl aminopeptidase family protein [Pseudaestuariivita sp.]|uniref:leucyl aminopeptidase family protein n=1 Tax=Pseudaestuariivita sp. TaxID=2211669 RepID=UPI0040587C20
MSMTFAPATPDAVPLFCIEAPALDAALAVLPDAAQAWAKTTGFKASLGETLAIPGVNGAVACALVGCGADKDRRRTRFALAAARARLPLGTYALDLAHAPALDAEVEALGWLLAGYSFRHYRSSDAPERAGLVVPEGVDAHRLEAIAAGEALTRTLINTPSNDMGPDELEAAARALATEYGATIDVTKGDALLAENFPLIHAVGRASTRAPRLIDLQAGTQGPKLTLVGKGVCFDTGGLNLKPGGSMGLMKKDMGGAANVLGLAHMILALKLPVQLRVLIPAVENSVSGNAFRPGDILTARNGLTVEINNTDAEGRLVLADALALACEDAPDLVISMATLTGAARVAVGPDLAPFYTDAEADAAALSTAANAVADPVWRLPFWDPYEAMIEPGIADLDNAPKGGFAGSITAALFLRRFAPEARYMHFDVYGWQPSAAPARPKGGVGQGTRALLHALPQMLDL